MIARIVVLALVCGLTFGKITLESRTIHRDLETHDELRMLSDDSAKCRSECYRENSDCCVKYPNECGSKCFEEARKCYDNCRKMVKVEGAVETKITCEDVRINSYNTCIAGGKSNEECQEESIKSSKECLIAEQQ